MSQVLLAFAGFSFRCRAELLLKRGPSLIEDFAKTCHVKRHRFAIFSYKVMVSKVIKYIEYKAEISYNGSFKV